MKNSLLFLIVLSSFFSVSSFAQEKRLIKGKVTTGKNKAPVPYASISLKSLNIGTFTNEEGFYQFFVPDTISSDSIRVSCLGYVSQTYFLKTSSQTLDANLEAFIIGLAEVEIRPLLPVDYILRSLSKVKENYADAPFATEAYYREQVFENNKKVSSKEGIFQSYFLSYFDTLKNQHQLLLHRGQGKLSDIEFMSDQADKHRAKNKKSAEKEGKPYTEKESELISLGMEGPETVLNMDFIKYKEPFLDSKHFKDFRYSFAPESWYLDRKLMVIAFEGKHAIDNLKLKGRIFIDLSSDAFVRIEYDADLKIPILVAPILYLYGLGIHDPVFSKQLNYQLKEGKWYPQDFHWTLKMSLSKRHFWSKNEHSDFFAEQIFYINKLEVNTPVPIVKEKRFVAKNSFESQVHNDKGLRWKDMNVIPELQH